MAFFSFWQVFCASIYLKPLLYLDLICNGLAWRNKAFCTISSISAAIHSGCGNGDGADKTSGDIKRITKEELKTLLDTQADVVVADTRSRNQYDSGHIPGAMSHLHDVPGRNQIQASGTPH